MLIFALMNINQNKINSVINKISAIGPNSINKMHLVYGEYDLIAELKAHNPDASADLLKSLKETDGVNSLKAYVVSNELVGDKEIVKNRILTKW